MVKTKKKSEELQEITVSTKEGDDLGFEPGYYVNLDRSTRYNTVDEALKVAKPGDTVYKMV